jgi:hypothetical protein
MPSATGHYKAEFHYKIAPIIKANLLLDHYLQLAVLSRRRTINFDAHMGMAVSVGRFLFFLFILYSFYYFLSYFLILLQYLVIASIYGMLL